jgi:hypothetical protein
MATILYTDNECSAADILYHHAPPNVTNYLAEKMQNYYQQAGGIGNEFLNSVKQRFDQFNNGSLMRHVEALKFKAKNLWEEDTIRFLPTIGDIQQAKPIMQRWVMANPMIRMQHYENGGVSAYDGKYIDLEEFKIGKDHYDYRRVTNGLFVKDGDNLSCTNYFEQVREGDVLTILEQSSILNTWTVLEECLEGESGIDPVSPWNEML